MLDILGNEIKVNDIVVSFNHLYIVKKLKNTAYFSAVLKEPSPTSKRKDIYCKFCIVVTPLIKE